MAVVPTLRLGPDIRAPLSALVERPGDWFKAAAEIEAVQIFQQQPAADDPASYNPVPSWVTSVGENNYQALVASGFFPKLRQMGIPLHYEGPGLKNWNPVTPGGKDWTPDGLRQSLDQICHAHRMSISRIRSAGGEVETVTIDDARAAARLDFSPELSSAQAAEATAVVIRQIRSLGVEVGLTEAMPTCSAEEIIDFRERLAAFNLGGPIHILLDIDAQHMHQVWAPQEIQRQLRLLYATCRAWTQGEAVCRFGIILNGQRGNDPQAYRSELMAFRDEIHGYLGEWPDFFALESWKTIDPALAAQFPNGLPENLPESNPLSHTGLVNMVAQVTGGG